MREKREYETAEIEIFLLNARVDTIGASGDPDPVAAENEVGIGWNW